MPDLYFYSDPEEVEEEEQATAEKAVSKEAFRGEWTAPAPEFTVTQPKVTNWSEGVHVPLVPFQKFPIEDWSAQPTTEDWVNFAKEYGARAGKSPENHISPLPVSSQQELVMIMRARKYFPQMQRRNSPAQLGRLSL
ncbi:hypothetical protein GH733_019026 [Mirounga leonina]|nr:hypothetical protein GH733_019026 [Mirounga leonina]